MIELIVVYVWMVFFNIFVLVMFSFVIILLVIILVFVIFFRIFFFEYDDLFFSITDFMCVWGLSFGIIICCDWSSCIRVFFDWLVNFV